tara:strand:+ start:376 stop:1599 length:1224 start_codon:yes stop_codon:yes gene_type:complete
VIDLGEQHLQGAFIKPGKPLPFLRKIATSLVRCDPTRDENACGLLQMSCSVPPEILYSTYWYRSGTNQTMRNHLKGIAEEAVDLTRAKSARVLDIGCNDGTLLSYYPDDFVKVGVDPSDSVCGVDKSIKIIQDIFPSPELIKEVGDESFEIITAIAMFYDLDDPIGFVKNIKKNLSPEGLWIFEMSYMPSMLKMNSYDTICHEHLEYYSLAVIEYILKKADMKIVKVSLNDINGGSIRCYATHTNNFKFKKDEFLQDLQALRRKEFDLELGTDKPYKNFQSRIDKHKRELISLLKKIKQEGKSIHVYGASTKGNTILQLCEIDNSIADCAADRNPDKYGAHTIGTNIPIVSEAESRAMNPDYYLVLPWHFREEFLEREKEALDKGTSFIFPLPGIEVVKRSLEAKKT